MGNLISNYFAGELTPKEKELFLVEVYNRPEYRKLFVEMQQLVAYMSLLLVKENEEKARRNLLHFMQTIEKNKFEE